MTSGPGHTLITLPGSVPQFPFFKQHPYFSLDFILSPSLVSQSGVRAYSCDFCGWLRHGCTPIRVEVSLGDSGTNASSSSGRAARINTPSLATCESASAESGSCRGWGWG